MKEELELDAQFGMEDLLCYVHVHQKSSTAHGSKCPMEKKGHSQRQSISGSYFILIQTHNQSCLNDVFISRTSLMNELIILLVM